MKEIEIIIDKNGEVSIDLKGYQGQGCSEIAKILANSIGKTVKNNKKCEYYNSNTNKTKNKLGN